MSLILSFFGGRRRNIFDPFSLDIWDPFQGFPNLSESALEISQFANMKMDWKEKPEAHVLKANLSGLKKEEVKVEVEEGRILQINSERAKEQEEKTNTWHRTKRSSSRFFRRFRLPENVKLEEVTASMENGELTVIIPKVEEKKHEMKSIDISG